MRRYIAVRLGLAVAVLWAAYTVSFIVLYLLPGDAVAAMAGGGMENNPVSEADLEALREQYGFNDPLIVQYFSRLFAALQGDFGTSIQSGQPVLSAIGEALPNTLQLAGAALLIALILGGGLALVATYTQRAWLRSFLLNLPPVAISLPTFWVGLLLLQLVSFQWGLVPAVGDHGLISLILPALTLAVPIGALIAQVSATTLTEALAEPYIVTARGKGISRVAIHLRHAARNASLPILTMVGMITGSLLAGSVVVEQVFSRNGVGRLTVSSVSFQDIPVVQGIVVLGAVVFVTANLIVDLILPLADPRVAIGKSYS